MKKYTTLLESLPAKTIVFAFGRFNPPTTGHELLVKLVKKLAQTSSADYCIYASATQDKKKNPLSVDRKIHYLNLMFPGTNFVAAGGDQRTFIEVAKHLNKKYKNLVMVAGSDRVPEYQKLLDKYNGTEFHFDSVKVVSAGERDPDADDASGMSASKMRAAATKGDFGTFRKGLPSTVREIDGKRLMNELRAGMGLEAIKEQIFLGYNALREAYINNQIFNIGDVIVSENLHYEIVGRGTNYLTLVNEQGLISKKWLHECTVVPEAQLTIDKANMKFEHEITKTTVSEELTDKTLRTTDKVKVARVIADMLGVENAESISPDVAVNTGLRKLKNKRVTPEMMAVVHKMIALAREVGIKIDPALAPKTNTTEALDVTASNTVGKQVLGYRDFQNKLSVTEQSSAKEAEQNAKNIADIAQANQEKKKKEADEKQLGGELQLSPGDVGNTLNPNNDPANDTVRKMKIRYKTEEVESVEEIELDEDIQSADYKVNPQTGRKYRSHHIEFQNSKMSGTPSGEDQSDEEDKPVRNRPLMKKVAEEAENNHDEFTEAELEDMAKQVDEPDDIIDAYNDSELILVDAETGEVVKEETETDVLNEVLSRVERMKARVRFAKTASKRERKIMVVLKSRSSSAVINKRARRVAVNLMKQRLLKKPVSQMTVAEKERAEQLVAKRKAAIDRLAMKLVPRIRKIESARLSHAKVTK